MLKWEFSESALASAPEGAQGNRGARGGAPEGAQGVSLRCRPRRKSHEKVTSKNVTSNEKSPDKSPSENLLQSPSFPESEDPLLRTLLLGRGVLSYDPIFYMPSKKEGLGGV